MNSLEALIQIKNLHKTFYKRSGLLNRLEETEALSGINLTIYKGEVLALVGESGCGKTTLGRCLLKLYESTLGEIYYSGTDITHFNDRQMKPFRKKIQMIFQDPYSSLNPKMSIGKILEEPLIVHKLYPIKAKRKERVLELLDLVGLPAESVDRFPHEFSGGQRQRVGIARALSVEPEFIVCDEPLSALDVSVQAQILTLLFNLQEKLGLTMLFITHDLRVVRYISQRVAVMNAGKIVELAETEELYKKPKHSYTQTLFSAIPKMVSEVSF